MFECIRTWKGLGRIYNIWLGPTPESFFAVGEIFSNSVNEYRVTECRMSDENPNKNLLEGKFENSTFVSLAPKSNLIASHDRNTIEVWDVTTQAKVFEFNNHGRIIHSSFVSNDGESIFISFNDGFTWAWNLNKNRLLYTFSAILSIHSRCFVLSPNKNMIVAVDYENRGLIKAWSYSTGEELWNIDLSSYSIEYVMSLALVESLNILVISNPQGHIVFWDMSAGQSVRSIQSGEAIETAVWDKHDNLLIIGNRYGNIRILDLNNHKDALLISAHGRSRIEAISIVDEHKFVSAGWHGTLKLWAKQ